VSALIDGNSVRVCGIEASSNLLKVATPLIEDRNNAALSGDVKATEALIKSEHIGICANRLNGRHFLCVDIKHR